VKLLEHGFEEQKRADSPGILIDSATKSIRVYRCVGQDFWSFIGNPSHPEVSRFVYLEVLLVLAKALARSKQSLSLEDRVNLKLAQLINALSQLMLPRNALPDWIREDFSEDELFWLTTALTAFFDQGI
jgi:hypothetical protein